MYYFWAMFVFFKDYSCFNKLVELIMFKSRAVLESSPPAPSPSPSPSPPTPSSSPWPSSACTSHEVQVPSPSPYIKFSHDFLLVMQDIFAAS